MIHLGLLSSLKFYSKNLFKTLSLTSLYFLKILVLNKMLALKVSKNV